MGQNSYWEIPSGTVVQIINVLLQAVKPYLSITVNNSLLFPQLRGRDPASRGDRYMLVNFEDVPYGIKVEFCFRVMSSFTLRRSAVRPTLHHVVIATSIVSRKSSGGAFIPLLKHGRHFVSMWAARNSGCYLYREVISEGGGGRGGGGWQTSLLYLFGPICQGTHDDLLCVSC